MLKCNSGVQSLKFALVAAEVALKSVDPFFLIKNSMSLVGSVLYITDVDCKSIKFDLSLFDSIYLVGAGKATAGMSEAVIHALGGRFNGGAITIPYDIRTKRTKLSITKAGHPLPDKNGLEGTKKILTVLDKVTCNDLVFVLISGGGSALMPLPVQGITLAEKQKITSTLLASGASIDEINIVRKHLSAIKGGRLAKIAGNGCTLIGLILSDVVEDKIDTIASGPTAPDKSTFHDAKLILQKHKLWNNERVVSESVIKIITDGIKKKIEDTPKPADPVFRKVHNVLIGSNSIACKKVFSYFNSQGIKTMNLGSSFVGKALNHGYFLHKLVDDFLPPSVPYAFVLGGETTVELDTRISGLGGRNQEAVLAAAVKFKSWANKDFTILCFGTDGIDGNSNAAGAILTPKTLSEIFRKNLDPSTYLRRHDSHILFKKLKSTIITLKTGTNVNDVSIVCRVK
ncbi:MAG: DUF4147 domain-containing protein [Thermoproteota archaeon]|nr:DUF4147 domain-containing protein [Thermoproteota archaeon]